MENIFMNLKYFIKGKGNARVQVPVSHIKAQGTQVFGLFFSKYNCRPCQLFYSKLISWYTRLRTKFLDSEKAFEIVFIETKQVSRHEFDVLFDSMPWLALPFEETSLAKKLGTKYHVNGLPTLVLINPKTGCTISLNACDYVDLYPKGENFPWPDMDFISTLVGEYFVRFERGDKLRLTNLTKTDVLESKFVILYFAGDEKLSTPSIRQLTNLCDKANKKDPSFKLCVAVIANCSTYAKYDQYSESVPKDWLLLPFGLTERYSMIKYMFHVFDFPSALLLDTANNDIHVRNVVDFLKYDPDGKDFPWYKKDVNMYDESHCDLIQDSAGVMWFTDGSPAQVREAMDIMLPIASGELHESDNKSLNWFLVADINNEQVADMLQFVNMENEKFPCVTILDFNQEVTYVCKLAELSKTTLDEFIVNYKGNHLEGIKMNL